VRLAEKNEEEDEEGEEEEEGCVMFDDHEGALLFRRREEQEDREDNCSTVVYWKIGCLFRARLDCPDGRSFEWESCFDHDGRRGGSISRRRGRTGDDHEQAGGQTGGQTGRQTNRPTERIVASQPASQGRTTIETNDHLSTGFDYKDH
jgi:hypothetical protein